MPNLAHSKNIFRIAQFARYSQSRMQKGIAYLFRPELFGRLRIYEGNIMKAVVFKDVGVISLEDVKEPIIQDQSDAIVKITASAICGTDLHFVRGTIPNMRSGTILGHEAVGVVEKIGSDVKRVRVGDRVIIPSTIACGECYFCLRGLTSQCDKANPNGPDAGAAFFGSPINSGSFNGLQAEKARVPFADAMLIQIPDSLSDEQVILLSDILPTSFMAVEYTDPHPDDTIAVFGAGPVGQLAIACLKKAGVKQIYAIDHIDARLAMAAGQGATTINFDKEDPVKALLNATNQRGPDKIIDAVGIDAQQPHSLMRSIKDTFIESRFKEELKEIAPKINPHGGNWIPGDGPSQVLQWALAAISKGGTLSIIGVYTPLLRDFYIGAVMGKNLTVRAGTCNHRYYFPKLLDWVKEGLIDLTPFITHKVPFDQVIEAYKHFDKREDNWIKVMLLMGDKK